MILRPLVTVGLLLQLHAVKTVAQCSVSATTTIDSQSKATSLASCSTFTGSIAIATDTADDISLDGVQALTGDLLAQDATKIQSLSADSLEIIAGNFTLDNLPKLSALSFPKLTAVEGIIWNDLGALSVLSFDAGVSQVATVDIQNTGLDSIVGITHFKTVDTVFVAHNPSLQDIELLLENFTTSVHVEDNSPTLSLNFPSLLWTFNLTASGCKSVFMPKMSAVNGSITLTENTFTDFALPKLESLGGSLTFQGNPDLVNISLPTLQQVGGSFLVNNNTALNSLNFDTIETIAGAVNFTGNFTNITLNALADVRGALEIASSGDIGDLCDKLQAERSSGVIKGKFVCSSQVELPGQGNNTTPSTPTTSSSTSSNSAASSSSSSSSNNDDSNLSSGAKAGVGVGIACGTLIAIGAFIFIRRRKRMKAEEQNTSEMPKGPQELNQGNKVQELSGTDKDHAHELQASHGASELHQLPPPEPQELPGSPIRDHT